MIYFILSGDRIKIGYSADAWQRLAHFQTANPARLEMLAVAEGGKPLETALHRQFAELRIPRSEWFHDDERIRAVAATMRALYPELQTPPRGKNKPLPFKATTQAKKPGPTRKSATCHHCGKSLSGYSTRLYCDDKCKKRAADKRYYQKRATRAE